MRAAPDDDDNGDDACSIGTTSRREGVQDRPRLRASTVRGIRRLLAHVGALNRRTDPPYAGLVTAERRELDKARDYLARLAGWYDDDRGGRGAKRGRRERDGA